MADRRLLASILTAALVPATSLTVLDPKSPEFSQSELLKAGMAGDQAAKTYQLILNALNHVATQEKKAMSERNNSTKNDAGSKGTIGITQLLARELDQSPDNELIAAIITSGMVPTLPPPKLIRAAGEWRDDDFRPMAELVSSALLLYTAMLKTLAEAQEQRSKD